MSPAGYRENKFHQVGGDVRGKKGVGSIGRFLFLGGGKEAFGLGKRTLQSRDGRVKERADNNFLFNVADSIFPIF